MKVNRVISNNAVVATEDDELEVVVLGRGVGFGVKPGDRVDPERVEQVFLANVDAADQRLSQFLADTPAECLRAAGQIAQLAHERLGVRVTQSLILPLADHLNFALGRARAGETIAFPLQWEVQQLYPREFDVGSEALRIADGIFDVPVDRAEAVAIAMHLVNVQFAGPGHADTVRMTETIARAFGLIEAAFHVTVDRHSMSATRFVTHLRYVFARIAAGKQITDPQPFLFETLTNAQPEAIGTALKIRYLIEMGFDTTLTDDETAYIGLHVARLLADTPHEVAKSR